MSSGAARAARVGSRTRKSDSDLGDRDETRQWPTWGGAHSHTKHYYSRNAKR